MIPWTVAGVSFDTEVPVLIGPHHPIIDEKDIDSVTLRMSNSGKLETPGSRNIVFAAQGEQKIC